MNDKRKTYEEQLAEATARWDAHQALRELKRRYGDGNEPCPDCGSMDHFEC